MDLGSPDEVVQRIEAAYKHAMDKNIYDKECYAASNSHEYWAEGTQAWLYATIRNGKL